MNLAILEGDQYVSLITDFCFFGSVVSLVFRLLRGGGKSHTKRLSINYCKNCNRSKCTERNILINLVAHLKTHVDSGRLSLLPVYLCLLFLVSML